MMIFDKIEIGLQPFGPTAGSRAVVITVEDAEMDKAHAEMDLEALHKELNTQIINAIELANFEELLIGKMPIVFRSNDSDIADKNIRGGLVDYLQQGLARRSLDFQLNDLKLTAAQVRPPFVIAETKGKVYSGNEMFYENFNIVLVTLDLDDTDLQAFALVELGRHKLATFMFMVESEADYEKFVEMYITPNYLPPIHTGRLWCVPAYSDDKAIMTERLEICKKIALEHGMRCGMHLV